MKRLSVLLSVLVTLTVLLSACGAPAPVATEAPAAVTQAPVATEAPVAAPMVLKYASSANITTWDPIASFSTEAAYMANMYEQLVRVNPPGSAETYSPLLAESWEKSTDGLVWTFKLRPNVKFHDGEPMIMAVRRSFGCRSIKWKPLMT
jgi:peptide/nickel transport system substrate-binding protein